MSDFVQAVADRCEHPVDEVRQTLADYGIRAYTTPKSAARLYVKRLLIEGVEDSNPFTWEWKLNKGVSALAGHNRAGKTPILEILRWMLTGRETSGQNNIDAVVRNMLTRTRLEFSLDDENFVVEVDAAEEKAPGRLERDGGIATPFNKDTMSDVLGDLMLDRFGLDRLTTFTHGAGSSRGANAEHGWPLYSGAMLVAPNHLDNVVGNVSVKTTDLIQVYLAIPWFETLHQARAVSKGENQVKGDQVKNAKAQEKLRVNGIEDLTKQLHAAQAELAKLVTEQDVAAQLHSAVADAGKAGAALSGAQSISETCERELKEAVRVDAEARRALVALKENDLAAGFFRALQPLQCPRCDVPIGDDRLKAEHDTHACSVCDRADENPSQDETALPRAQTIADDTAEALTQARNAAGAASKRRDEAQAAHENAQALVQRLSTSTAHKTRSDKQQDVLILRGRLQEREEAAKLAASAPEDDTTVAILSAAVDEAAARVEQNADVMVEISEYLLPLVQRFGIDDMTALKLKRNGHVDSVKSGAPYTYGKLSPGDKLRMKVAVAVGMLRIGTDRNVCRHPGLLIVDSPGAQEVDHAPLQAMLSALVELCDELDIQVIIATAREEDVEATVPAANIARPSGSHFW